MSKEELSNTEEKGLANRRAKLGTADQKDSAASRGGMQGTSMDSSAAKAARGGEQDLSGFESREYDLKDVALRRLAHALGNLAVGEDHREWALAKKSENSIILLIHSSTMYWQVQ